MSTIGTNSQPLPHAGCGGPTQATATAMPNPAALAAFGGGFGGFGGLGAFPGFAPAAAMPVFGTAAAMPVERFVSSQAGGVILDKDGAPAGRIPAGSFVDTKDGTIFGADGKAITLPEGATADFFDLPDVKQLMADAKSAAAFAAQHASMTSAATTASGPTGKAAEDHAAMMKSFVDGQWGPGGVTPMTKSGGGAGAGGCDMDHAKPATTATTASGGGSSVAGASGGGSTTATGALPALTGNPMIDGINKVISDLMAQVRRLTPTPAAAAATGGGTATLAASSGAAALGSTDLLRLSVNDLVSAVGQLNLAIRETGILGGGPGKDTAPPKTPAPPVEPPKTEVPTTSSSPSTDSTVAPPAAGSSST